LKRMTSHWKQRASPNVASCHDFMTVPAVLVVPLTSLVLISRPCSRSSPVFPQHAKYSKQNRDRPVALSSIRCNAHSCSTFGYPTFPMDRITDVFSQKGERSG